jgi:hypothetical protein
MDGRKIERRGVSRGKERDRKNKNWKIKLELNRNNGKINKGNLID